MPDSGIHPERCQKQDRRQSRLMQQCPILRLQGRPDHLATKHGDLVAEHDDLDRQLIAVSPAQAHQLENPGEGEVEKR